MATQIGTVIDGKYEILKQIGKGGMSTVYLAMDKRLNKQWAVKEISRKGFGKNNEEIINEVPADAEMMKALDHPAIPTIVDIIDNKSNEFIYVVMDYVEGESLDKVLAEYGAQPQEVVIDWAKQICDALGYLHNQKPPIIYRDMKPANVMLKPEGNIKIIDFGIAREYKEGNLADTTVLGTKGYASPEHYGGRQTDERSDIYTLGMTMHHLLTGVDPRPADYIYAPIRQWNPELSDGLERIIDKCVSPDPKDRYQNCDELLYALEHYKDDEAQFKKKQRRKLAIFIISVILAIIFAVAGLVTNSLAKNYENENYNNLISIKNYSFEEAQEKIKKAIEIDKTNRAAYDAIITYVIEDKNIDQQEKNLLNYCLDQLETVYTKGNDKGDKEAVYDEIFVEIDYQVATKLFYYYNVETASEDNTKERALVSIKYFEKIKDGDFKDSEMASHFYNICNFYNVANANGVERPDYKALLEAALPSIESSIEYLDSYTELDANFVKTVTYKSYINFINNNRDKIAKNIDDENRVISILNLIEQKTNALDIDDDEEPRAYQTQQYILDKISEFRENVVNAYTNLNR